MIQPNKKDIKPGDLVWMSGPWKGPDYVQFFEENPALTGPYFVKRVVFPSENDARVDILNPENGEEKSVMSSWLRVPKEEKCRK